MIATTFTLIAVFLPTAFASGVAGKFFVQFGWTAAIAVFFSLVVARMLTPMMAAPPAAPGGRGETPPRWLTIYGGWAAWCLQRRKTTSPRPVSSSSARSRSCPAADRLPCRRTTSRRRRSICRCSPVRPSGNLRRGRAGAAYRRTRCGCQVRSHRRRRRQGGQ